MENESKGLRHGENLLVRVPAIPSSGTKTFKNYIVGHSETGHHHVLESTNPFDVVIKDNQLFIELFANANLVHKKQHDKHNTLVVQPGKYLVKRKQEYSPWEQTMREVFD
ncbi:hypothetical protein [Mycobacteroides abscessus]|uniref:hypothetical protein n=1 Tax=Mycobacteroides abscessus TaxID=36809 RepID=UPI000C2568AC|nr:hypothetical protein [Mycobacteroides abscessus]